MTWQVWYFIGYYVLNAALMVMWVGRPRPPISPGVALVCLIITAFNIGVVISLGSQ